MSLFNQLHNGRHKQIVILQEMMEPAPLLVVRTLPPLDRIRLGAATGQSRIHSKNPSMILVDRTFLLYLVA